MIIIEADRDDDGSWRHPSQLAADILDVDPGATVRTVKGSVVGVEVTTATAVKYLMTLYTAAGNRRGARKGRNDG